MSSSLTASNSLAKAASVFSIVVGQTRSRITPAWEPTGYMRASAKSSSKVTTI